jgi:two-component system, NtrC family, response regulator AtoC
MAELDRPIRGVATETIWRLGEKVAASTIPVMMLGETGVGKGVFARELHRLSRRAERPFLAINCAALPERLLESELFGYERGAFTGADRAKPGLLETAQGGTVFLDEIGEMPLPLQAKLLRAIEEQEVIRIGGLVPRPIDVRFIAATNRRLEDGPDARGEALREDLYFRLAGATLAIPPLRERTEEIPALAARFAAEGALRAGRTAAPALADATVDCLARYPWPGNVRELRNVVHLAVVLCEGDRLMPEHLPAKVSGFAAREAVRDLPAACLPVAVAREELRRPGLAGERGGLDEDRVREALRACGGNQTRAAKWLGVSRRTLVRRLDAFRLPRPLKDAPPATGLVVVGSDLPRERLALYR